MGIVTVCLDSEAEEFVCIAHLIPVTAPNRAMIPENLAAQRDKGTCLRPHCKPVLEVELKPRSASVHSYLVEARTRGQRDDLIWVFTFQNNMIMTMGLHLLPNPYCQSLGLPPPPWLSELFLPSLSALGVSTPSQHCLSLGAQHPYLFLWLANSPFFEVSWTIWVKSVFC